MCRYRASREEIDMVRTQAAPQLHLRLLLAVIDFLKTITSPKSHAEAQRRGDAEMKSKGF
jgi:hypothetical protein